MKTKRSRVLAALALLLLLAACAAGANAQVGTADAQGVIAGFWRGLWHGLILPITFIVSLFTKSVQVYEVHNNGNWYNFGYALGLLCSVGGGGHGGARATRRRR